MNEDLLASYAFLAALNENGTDLYKAVYIPMCKRAFAFYAKNHNQGTDTDIKETIKNIFDIDVPLLVTRKLILAVNKDLSKKSKEKFKFQAYKDGSSFQFDSFVFFDLEDSYEKERRNTNALQQAFEVYVKENGYDIEDRPSFSSFIYKYKNKLSSFLLGKVDEMDNIEEVSFMLHARFLQYVETNNNDLYQVIKNIFIGSIIASYIEADLDISAKFGDSICYYLDSKVVLEALDLQNSEDTQPTQELIKLIKETGGKVKLLNITLLEIHNIIEAAINSFNKDTPTSSINEACIRKGKNKTWLLQYNAKLKENIIDTLGVEMTEVSESDKKKFSESEDTKALKKIWYRKNAAEHDVIAYLYVREKRKQDANKTLFQKARHWFITENERLYNFNLSRKINGYPNEIALPQNLSSLLFLQNPQKYTHRVSSIGLNELIAQTISNEYPSRDILNEFDKALENINISSDEYDILLSEVSQYSTTKFQELLESSVAEPERFNSEIHSAIAKARQQKVDMDKQRKQDIQEREKDEAKRKELENNNQSLMLKIDEISKQIANMQKRKEEDDENYLKLIEKNKKLELKDWKRKKYWIFGIILVVCIIVFILYFVEFNNNVFFDLIKIINNLTGTWHDLAAGLLIVVHAGLAVISIKALFTIGNIKTEDDKSKWLKKIVCDWFNNK